VRVGIGGGGPAGLYLAILLRRAGHEVRLRERNPPGVTYGWGVVFSDESLADLRDADYETYLQIDRALVRWSSIDTHYAGELIRSTGHGFAAIARTTLLRLLAERAVALGADLAFSTEVPPDDPLAPFAGCDLVVAADGVRSVLRTAHADAFRTTFSPTASKYVWFGADFALPVFTFIFTPTPHGLFQVHSYPYDAHRSTFIVECSEAAWRSAGLDAMGEADGLAFCQDLFAPYLGGHRLLSNESVWRTFVTVRNRSWHCPVVAGGTEADLVLVGDAAHTAHFSIGSGTRLALDDSIALAKAFVASPGDRAAALAAYEGDRQPIVERFQEVATDSARYFESVSRYLGFAPEPFAFNLLTRSGRIGHNNLTARDPVLVNRVDRRFHGAPGGRIVVPPPLLTPLRLAAGCEVPNRVVVASGTLNVAVDGLIGEAHAGALAAAAATGAGLVVTEEVAPSPHGRVTTGSPGLWRDEHTEAWAKVAAAVHETGARLALRLTDAGRRGATLPRERGLDRPLPSGSWTLWAPAALPYSPRSRRPEAIPARGREIVLAAHVDATTRAADAGVDVLLLDMSDGYLLASFLSPLSNPDDDDDRSAFPLAVLAAVRAAWPADRPLAVRLVADDRVAGGLTPEDGVVLARRLSEAGADLIDVTAGHTVPHAAAEYRRLFNAGLADRVRNEAGVAVVAGGHITRLDEVNTLLAAGRADLCRLDPSAYRRGVPL
jgi:anthraniloyl-CoA monooxygenase